LPGGEWDGRGDGDVLQKILAGVLVALAALSAVSKAEACDACAAFFKERQTYEGKLVKVIEEACPPEANSLVYPRQNRLNVVWVLKTADKKYELKLGSRTLTRLAAKLEGCDVIVTGKDVGGTIDVRGLEAKGAEFTGTISRIAHETEPLPVRFAWKLKTAGGELNLIFEQKAHVAHAKDLLGKRVVVKGRKTAEGVVVTSLAASE
jgi:hypothetical protein